MAAVRGEKEQVKTNSYLLASHLTPTPLPLNSHRLTSLGPIPSPLLSAP